MNLIINDKTYLLKEAKVVRINVENGEDYIFFFTMNDVPELQFRFTIGRRENSPQFNSIIGLTLLHQTSANFDNRYVVCPFCHSPVKSFYNRCLYLNNFLPDLLRQLLELSPIRLKTIHFKNNIDYETIRKKVENFTK